MDYFWTFSHHLPKIRSLTPYHKTHICFAFDFYHIIIPISPLILFLIKTLFLSYQLSLPIYLFFHILCFTYLMSYYLVNCQILLSSNIISSQILNGISFILYVYDEFVWYFGNCMVFSASTSSFLCVIHSLSWNNFSFFGYVGIQKIKADDLKITGVIQK